MFIVLAYAVQVQRCVGRKYSVRVSAVCRVPERPSIGQPCIDLWGQPQPIIGKTPPSGPLPSPPLPSTSQILTPERSRERTLPSGKSEKPKATRSCTLDPSLRRPFLYTSYLLNSPLPTLASTPLAHLPNSHPSPEPTAHRSPHSAASSHPRGKRTGVE